MMPHIETQFRESVVVVFKRTKRHVIRGNRFLCGLAEFLKLISLLTEAALVKGHPGRSGQKGWGCVDVNSEANTSVRLRRLDRESRRGNIVNITLFVLSSYAYL